MDVWFNHSLLPFESAVLLIGRAAVFGAALSAAIWLLCRKLPQLPPALRCWLWWLCCAQMLLALCWPATWRWDPAAMLPTSAATSVVEVRPAAITPVNNGALQIVQLPVGHAPAPVVTSAFWHRLLLALGLIWLGGVSAGAVLLLRDGVLARRLIRNACSAPAALQALLQQEAELLALPRVPELRLSDAIQAPQLCGLWQATVLLPQDMGELSPVQLRLALRHELLHLRRGDLRLAWVPVMAQRLFFFSPLAALAVREYELAREQAVDAAVLADRDVVPRDYGQLLLHFGVERGPGLILATASPSVRHLQRRLTEMNRQELMMRGSRAAGWLTLFAVAVACVSCAAAGPRPAPPTALQPALQATADAAPMPMPLAQPSLRAAPAPQATSSPQVAEGAMPPLPPLPPAAPPSPLSATGIPPVPPAPPAPPAAPPLANALVIHSHAVQGDPSVVAVSSQHQTSLHIATGNGVGAAASAGTASARRHASSFSFSTSAASGKPAAFSIYSADGEPGYFVWSDPQGQVYKVTDAATVAQAHALLQPGIEWSDQQGALGDRQQELGEQQGELGEQQQELGMEQAALEQQLQVQINAGARLQGEAARQATVQAEQLREQIDGLSARQRALDQQQQALSKRQKALEAEQQVLAQHQEAERKTAFEKLKQLERQAIAEGKAQVVNTDS